MSTDQTISPTAAPPQPAWARLRRHPFAPLLVLLAATFMFVLDFFIVNVALPAVQTDLSASSGAIEWVVAGYGLTLAVGLVTAGRLGDRYGRRRMFALGLALFTLASAACGVAPDATTLVIARLAQGLSAALLSPQVLSIVGVTYDGEARLKALSAYGLVMGLAAVGGQLIGGALVQLDVLGLDWRACFLINVPIGLAALALTPSLVPESRAAGASRPDLAGTVLLTAGLTAIVLPLVEGRQHDWPAWTWLSLAAAPLLLGAFVAHQRWLSRRGGAPLVPPALFRARAVSAGLGTQLALWCGQASFFLVLALYLQQGRGLDALDAGLVFTVLAATYLLASLRAPALTMRFGRALPGVGALTLVAGHAALALALAAGGTHVALVGLLPGLLLVGAGMGLCITPLVTTVLSTVEPASAGATSGLLSTMQQVGGAVGVAVIGVVFFGSAVHGAGHAFELSELLLAGLALVTAALSRLLPRAAGAAGARQPRA